MSETCEKHLKQYFHEIIHSIETEGCLDGMVQKQPQSLKYSETNRFYGAIKQFLIAPKIITVC